MIGEEKQKLQGRKRIYTDVEDINKDNIIDIVSQTFLLHMKNSSECQKLRRIERGEQELQRKKEIRPDIDIQDICNLPNYITSFKLGYNWGNTISYVQRKDSKTKNDNAISLLNNMLDIEGFQTKNQEMFESMEITGLGYYFVDVKREIQDDEPPFEIAVIDPEYCYKVYLNDTAKTPVLDVIFRRYKDGKVVFTCFTKEKSFCIIDKSKVEGGRESDKKHDTRSGEVNVLGRLPLVEFNRTSDLMGCFEREISSIETLSTMNSDFANGVAQDVQGINWLNDVELPKDEEGNEITPSGGQWLITYTSPEGKTPIVKPVQFSPEYAPILNKISFQTGEILKRCFVPQTVELNGGSSGNAMSMSSGWTQAEANAQRQELIVKKPLLQLLALVLEVCKVKKHSVLKDLAVKDIEPRIVRNKTYDLATKTNSLCALLSHGISLKDALIMCDLSGDVAQIIENSSESVKKYQENLYGDTNDDDVKSAMGKTGLQDIGDQDNNSPQMKGVMNYKK